MKGGRKVREIEERRGIEGDGWREMESKRYLQFLVPFIQAMKDEER